ncbi:MAG: putative secreted protein [Parcubacteria group bacterium Gr01-1014_44]|nr:MAG: putative secreted protein [Parcubacteria group bacterium Gr01-1014_44]
MLFIKDMLSKLLEFIKSKQAEVVLAIGVVLIAIIAFESGKISALRRFNDPLEIKYAPASPAGGPAAITNPDSGTKTNPQTSQSPQKLDLRVVASKNSTLYHFLWCSGAQKIKEENKITFATEQEAQSRGYELASNCRK